MSPPPGPTPGEPVRGTAGEHAGDRGTHIPAPAGLRQPGDTGGILGDDWTTVNTTKQAYLDPYLIPAGRPAARS